MTMNKRIGTWVVTLLTILTAGSVCAQVLPANPTSADNLKISIPDRTCGGIIPYKFNPYRVSMVQNIITVILGEHVLNPMPLCPLGPREEIDLGRLPAGSYSLTVNEGPGLTSGGPLFSNVPFTVTDARLTKSAPYVRLDYSGQWWDPNDSGWGLFIWQDARSLTDSVLAAWFTYTPDGKPMWYVFQPTWQTSSATFEVPLMQSSRLSGATSPPPNPTAINFAGTASLDFTHYITASLGPPYFTTADEGKLTYQFNGGPTQTRIIKRFNTGTVREMPLPGLAGAILLPANPTSADNLKINMSDHTCGGGTPYKANPYGVSMLQGNIVVTLGERRFGPVPLCPGAPREEIDLGRLPAGTYTLSIRESPKEAGSRILMENIPFTVADARINKFGHYVRLDYSGHWWDPNDSGWGLFIWQDARSSVDSVLAAWFTYTPDGKPMWYVFQPTWQTSSATVEVPLMQTSRPPGTNSPPPNPTPGMVAYTLAGTVSLDFTNFGTADEGKLTYTFNGGPKLVRTIQRFKP